MKYGMLVIACTLLSACASPVSTTLIGAKRPSINPAQVTIYTEKPPSYQPVALLSVTSDGSWRLGDEAKMNVVIERLKGAAAKVGANGVLLQSTGERQDDSVYVGTGIGRYSGNVGLSVQLGRFFGLTDKTAEGLAIFVEADE